MSDAVGDDYLMRWIPSTPVFLSSQTGTGKNYFVQNVLVPTVMKYNRTHSDHKKVLILSNRVALNRQNKQEQIRILDEYKSINEISYMREAGKYTDRGMDEYQSFGNIDICSYHRLLSSSFLEEKYAFVIIDECHFFVNDATFNCDTEKILDAIIGHFSSAVRVYMSATLDLVFDPIMEREKCHRKDIRIYEGLPVLVSYEDDKDGNEDRNEDRNEDSYILGENIPFYMHLHYSFYHLKGVDTWCYYADGKEIETFTEYDCAIYDMKYDYSYINDMKFVNGKPITKDGIDPKLLEHIGKNDEKWIIFVRSKNDGENLAKALNNKFGSNVAAFICSESKNNTRGSQAIYDEIVKNQTFGCRILIATPVIDNGISIKDMKVKHVVIYLFQRVSFMQMLGRIRIADNHQITLYIPKYNEKEIRHWFKGTVRDLIEKIYFENLNDEGKRRFYNRIQLQQGGTSGYKLSVDGIIYMSALVKEYLADYALFLKRILRRMGVDDTIEFEGEDIMEMYFGVLRLLEDKTSKTYLEEKIHSILSNEKLAMAPSEIPPNFDMMDNKSLKVKLEEAVTDGNSYKGDVGLVRCFQLLRYRIAVGKLNTARKKNRDFLDQLGYLTESDFLDEADENDLSQYQLLEEKRAEAYQEVVYYRNCFNYGYTFEPGDPIIGEHMSWIGRFPTNEESSPDTPKIINTEAIKAFFDDAKVDETVLEQLDEEHFDKCLVEKGFSKGIDSPKLEILSRFIRQKCSKPVKQLTKINEFLESENIGYSIISKKIRSTKTNNCKGKVYWLIVKKSQ